MFTYKAVLRQQGVLNNQQTLNTSSPAWNPQQATTNPSNNNASIDQILQQQEALREQIRQSEQNLTAQHTVQCNVPAISLVTNNCFAGVVATTTSPGRGGCE